MCHTSESYYMIQNLSEVAAHGHEVLETVKTQRQISPFKKTPKVLDSVSKNNALVDEFLADDEQQREKEYDLSPSKRLTEDQEDDIDLPFSDIINTNAQLSLSQTKNIMSETMNLASYVNDVNMVKKVTGSNSCKGGNLHTFSDPLRNKTQPPKQRVGLRPLVPVQGAECLGPKMTNKKLHLHSVVSTNAQGKPQYKAFSIQPRKGGKIGKGTTSKGVTEKLKQSSNKEETRIPSEMF